MGHFEILASLYRKMLKTLPNHINLDEISNNGTIIEWAIVILITNKILIYVIKTVKHHIFSDEHTMSMYISCFVHEGIEEISVNLFEGTMKDIQNIDEVWKLIMQLFRTAFIPEPFASLMFYTVKVNMTYYSY